MNEGGWCRYRGPNGTSCAFGCLIPDSMYNANGMESKSVQAIFDQYPEVKALFPESRALIYALQLAHDRIDEYKPFMDKDIHSDALSPDMKVRLRRIATDYNLDASILDKLTFPEVWK